MGSGIAPRLAKDHMLSLYDSDEKRAKDLAKEIHATAYHNPAEAVMSAEATILAVKPQNLQAVSRLIQEPLRTKRLLVSILAGVSTQVLREHFPHVPILRMMPNLAVSYGQGVIGLAENHELEPEVKKSVEEICLPLGYSYWMAEDKLNALTSLTGSGPAFVLVLIESMVEAAIAMGFNADQGRELVLQMLTGTLAMLRETEGHPGNLKWKVTSPGGTTIAGLQKLEEGAVRAGVFNSFLAAFQRAQELNHSR